MPCRPSPATACGSCAPRARRPQVRSPSPASEARDRRVQPVRQREAAAGSDRAQRRQRSLADRKHEIVTAAASVFDRDGYGSTSMDDIARTVGIAKPTLYHYFSSKDEILTSIHEEFIDLLLDR